MIILLYAEIQASFGFIVIVQTVFILSVRVVLRIVMARGTTKITL